MDMDIEMARMGEVVAAMAEITTMGAETAAKTAIMTVVHELRVHAALVSLVSVGKPTNDLVVPRPMVIDLPQTGMILIRNHIMMREGDLPYPKRRRMNCALLANASVVRKAATWHATALPPIMLSLRPENPLDLALTAFVLVLPR
jgi:hypothetical protein